MVMKIEVGNSCESTSQKASAANGVAFGSDALRVSSLPTATEHEEILKHLPALSTLVAATSSAERSYLATTLRDMRDKHTAFLHQPEQGDRHVVRDLADVDALVNDRIERGLAILNTTEIPQEVVRLSPHDQVELAQAMAEKRHLFWTKLYEVPFVQREVISILESLEPKQGIISTILFPPRTDEYRNATKSVRDQMLLESARASLREIRELGEHADAGIGSDYRQKVASILARTPLAPERALALASECKRKAHALIEAEIRGSGQPLPEGGHCELTDFAASALQVRGFIAELSRLEQPYSRLKNYMVMSMAGLAQSFVNRTPFRRADEKSDLFQSGIVGIMRGVERFDPGYGTMLSTSIFPGMQQAVRIEQRVGALAVSIPPRKLSEFFKIRALSQDRRQSPQLLERAAQQGVSAEDALAFVALVYPARSLDYRSENLKGGSSTSLSETLAERNTVENDEGMNREDLQHQLSLAFRRLTNTEREIVSMFFGLDGGTKRSDAEIGAKLGMSTERVRSFRNRSIARLQRDATAQGIHELYGAR